VAQAIDHQFIKRSKLRLRILEDDALNAEAYPELLDEAITPFTSFFIRNNGHLPDISPEESESWAVTVEGEVDKPIRWSLSDLKRSFEVVSITAVLECAGNGRAGFVSRAEGLQWTTGAVGCARWGGVRLRDVLLSSGIKNTAVYVGHYSPDVQVGAPDKPALSRGLPIIKATAPETLLAFAMNGEPLPVLHGGPLRIVAPGFPGSAWQKWLTRIRVRDCEHDGEKMGGTHYRLPRRPITPNEPIDPSLFDVITDMPVKSLITSPVDGFNLRLGEPLRVRGFAWSGHTALNSVSISANGGETWQLAELQPSQDRFAWQRFAALLRPPAEGALVLMARATDQAGRMQPLTSPAWNPRGYCNNSVHRVCGLITSSRQ
jgi:DMSO/TMAO reductase YedYZ molybdopterin-dependent catalytic subunit